MGKKCLRYIVLFLYCLFCFVLQDAKAQEYFITQSQIEQLVDLKKRYENQSANLKQQLETLKNRQRTLTEQSANLNQQSQTLKAQLEEQKALTESLQNSYDSYRDSASRTINQQMIQIEKQNQKIKDLFILTICLSVALTAIVVIKVIL